MKRRVLILLMFMLVLGLTCCKKNNSENNTEEADKISQHTSEVENIFLKLSDMEYYVCAGTVSGVKAYVKADDGRIKEALKSLDTTKLSDVSDKEQTLIMGQSILLKFKEKETEYFLRFTSGNNLLYVQYTDDESDMIFCGENKDNTLIVQLVEIQNEILADTEDTVDVGHLQWDETDEFVNKGITAMVKAVLEKNLSSNEVAVSELGKNCLAVTINETTYQVDTETGRFLKTENDNVESGVLEEQSFMEVCNLLGIEK